MVAASYKPTSYNSASPYLVVASAVATMTFLERALGAERLRIVPRTDGSIMHAEMRIDDSVVMIGESTASMPTNVHIYVPDVEAAFSQAVAAGGEIVQDVQSRGDGDRRGGVRDPNGITWWLATQEDTA
jgi:PhnB protein